MLMFFNKEDLYRIYCYNVFCIWGHYSNDHTLSWYLLFLGKCDFNMSLIKQEGAGIKMLYLIDCKTFNRKINAVSNVMGLLCPGHTFTDWTQD